jgi:hypothetical protein
MAHSLVRRLAWASILALGTSAHAQTAGSPAPEGAGGAGACRTTSPAQGADQDGQQQTEPGSDSKQRSLLDWLLGPLSHEEDPDGPINTDRPTFTPANTVVPPGRLQFESGYSDNQERTSTARGPVDDFPELSVRYGLTARVELRTLWLGQTVSELEPRAGRRQPHVSGPSDMEVGFKWQLFAGDNERKWIPTTAVITSVIAPTGGTSPFSSQTVQPYINPIYGWNLTDKLTLSGSTGYLGMRVRPFPGTPGAADSFSRFHQSLVAFYSPTKRTTLFYEWYVFMFTNAADNRPTHFMDGGVIYHPTPNTQIDLRAGFGLSGRPDDFFSGAGFSVRF